jgi:N-acylneuraminate cytidylyltransferase
MMWPENLDVRSQDLPAAYHDAGQFYWLRVADFLAEKRLFGSKTFPLVVPEMEVQDIDTEEDWSIAEMKFQLMRRT